VNSIKKKIAFAGWAGIFLLAASGGSFAAQRPYPFLTKITRSAYPHAHAVLAKEKEHIRFRKDGRYVDRDEIFMMILDEKGKQSERIQSFYINRDYAKLTVEVMEVIKPDGNAVPVDLAANSREDTPRSNTEANIYDPTQKVLKVFLPDLQVGDTIHYRVLRDYFKAIIPNHFYGMVLGQYTFPVRFYQIVLEGPEHVKLHTLIKDRVKGTVSYNTREKDGRQIHQWTFRDVPQITPEPAMPSFMRVSMRLLYSTLASWEEASRWYAALVEPKLTPTPEIIRKAEALIKGLSGNAAKARAIYYFVAQKIRYMGITAEKNRPGFEPHAVSLTFNRRYGVCRDKAALLVSMLRIAGLKANMVLVSVGSKLDREIPVPYFNHAVAVLRGASKASLTYMDPTSETSKQFFPDYERDSSSLIADKQGEPLRITPALPPERNQFQLTIRDVFSSGLSLYGKINGICTGFIDTVFRSIMMAKGKQEREAFLQRMFKRRYPGIETENVRCSDPADRAAPFSFSLDFRIKKAAVSGQKGVAFLLPLSSMKDPGVLDRWILGKANMVSRKYPLRFGYTYKTRIQEVINFKEIPLEIRLPATSNISDNIVDCRTSYAIRKDSALVITREFALKKIEVTPEQYKQILSVQHDRQVKEILPVVLRSQK